MQKTVSVRPDSNLKDYLRLLRYLKPLLWLFGISALGFTAYGFLQPLLPELLKKMVMAIETKDSAARLTLPLMAVGIFTM